MPTRETGVVRSRGRMWCVYRRLGRRRLAYSMTMQVKIVELKLNALNAAAGSDGSEDYAQRLTLEAASWAARYESPCTLTPQSNCRCR